MKSSVFLLVLFFNFVNYNVAEDINIDDRNLKDLLIDLDVGEDNKNYHNPNDMLAPPKIPSTAKKKASFILEDIKDDEDSCLYENRKVAICSDKLRDCSRHLEQIENQLANEKKRVDVLSAKTLDKKNIDVKEFYKRIMHRFWLLLNMESTGQHLRGDNDAATFNLFVKVTQRDIDAFKEYFRGEHVENQIDLFFSEAFYTSAKEEIQVFQFFKGMINKLHVRFRSFDFWLNLFWLLIIIVGIWGFYLFVADIQRELSWKKVMVMVLVLAFLISFIHQWRYMIKVQEAKRNSMISEMRINDFEEAACLEDNSIWFKIKSTVFGTRSKCEEYHEKMMIPPNEEVSVGMALMETLTTLVLLPLKSCGLHFALFFNNFFTNIPWMFQLPSVIIFVGLFTVIIFAIFGYGIHFPLWMGSIRPERPRVDSSESLKKLIKESEDRVERINSAMIKDAKEMLSKVSDIAIAQAQSSSSTYLVEPIVQQCTQIIEKKLEALVNKKIVNGLEYSVSPQDACTEHIPHLIEDEVDKNKSASKGTDQKVSSLQPYKILRETSRKSSQEGDTKLENVAAPTTTTNSHESENDFMIKVKRIFEEHEQ